MSLKHINTALAIAVVLFTFYLGVSFLLSPGTQAPGFGLPSWPSGDGGGFLIVKGNRENAMGLMMGVLLVTGHRRALGWVLLMVAAAPFGDMITVLAHHGSMAAAFGIHGLTSALIAVTGLLILRETGKARTAPETRDAGEAAAPAHAAQSA
ncbi:DUF4267 domain-containing protein [Actinomadura verrucosospora]|uniref:Small membrane hydrophobic protein n=1 Tax=Actinomadura verrucosospora TaxID=46165 RepID=A0A7D4AK46_ACTVE|nr:DUF4267 domain-containing protein [Actinomadura verrucosospora]QKG18589.1 small membrane hydrophobic protein [Actinomadura verrucosospora]